MNLSRLYEILMDTTMQLRKGEAVEETTEHGVRVVEEFDMPHESEAESDIVKVDVEFIVVGVRKALAQSYKKELIAILQSYPHPERLAGGPSYIEVGAVLGDQGAALQLFALGEVLDLWHVITPTKLGLTGVQARAAAGRGFVMMSGFKPDS